MKNLQKPFSLLLFAVLLAASFSPALGAQAENVLTRGTVVSLQGTPHLWFADEEGVLHWGGDTRALAGRYINWNIRVEVSVEELQVFAIGDPWLSAGLIKEGDPIYLVKWESDWTEPRLLHIQSWSDAELFGLSGNNYGNLIFDAPTWEAEFGHSVAELERSSLDPATNHSDPAPGSPPCPGGRRIWTLKIRGRRPRVRPG